MEFPPQPNDPHRLIIRPLSLKCYPQYSRSNNISFVYSSSVTKAATVPIKNKSLYTTFMVYFMDYRPPNFFIFISESTRRSHHQHVSRNIFYIQRTYSKLMKEKGIFTTHRSRNIYNPSPPFVLQR